LNNWISITIIVIAFIIIIGNFSTFQKNSKQPLRKKGLNDLKETLPRSNKQKHSMDTVTNKK